MPITVKIRHFQSLKKVDLELTGFTVITGTSNTGKSAVIRAIQAAIFGALGDYFITDLPKKEDQCAVGIVDGTTTIKWWKVRSGEGTPTKGTSLEVNGTKFTKFGKEQAELTKPLGFVELDVGGEKIRPQIALQFDPIFLITGSETEAAAVLKLLGRVDAVTEAQRLSSKDARETALKLKVRKDDFILAKTKEKALGWTQRLIGQYSHIASAWLATGWSRKVRQTTLEFIKTVQGLSERIIPNSLQEARIPQEYYSLLNIQSVKETRVREIPAQLSTVRVPYEKINQRQGIEGAILEGKSYYATVVERNNCEAELDGLYEERQQMEKELGNCPLCGRNFDTRPHNTCED